MVVDISLANQSLHTTRKLLRLAKEKILIPENLAIETFMKGLDF